MASPQTADDEDVAPYADYHFEYNSQGRVSSEVVQGTSGGCSGGLGTYTFTYTTSAHADGVNNWMYKTVETLPAAPASQS